MLQKKIQNFTAFIMSTYTRDRNVCPGLPVYEVKCPESKEQRGENSDFLFLGRPVRADIFGRLFLSSQKSSAYACKSKNVESAVKINNLLPNKYPICMFD